MASAPPGLGGSLSRREQRSDSSLGGSPARIPVYTRSIVFDAEASPTEACWRVVGDRESLQTAECQSIHRDFRDIRPRGDRSAAVVSDIVVAAAAPERDHTGGPVRVFGDKTQGYPYHLAMLAAAMIIEGRFPSERDGLGRY